MRVKQEILLFLLILVVSGILLSAGISYFSEETREAIPTSGSQASTGGAGQGEEIVTTEEQQWVSPAVEGSVFSALGSFMAADAEGVRMKLDRTDEEKFVIPGSDTEFLLFPYGISMGEKQNKDIFNNLPQGSLLIVEDDQDLNNVSVVEDPLRIRIFLLPSGI